MCGASSQNTIQDGLLKLRSDDIHKGHVMPDKLKENEKLLVLRSMVPSISEVDKASVLDDTIKYLKELEARAEEMESCMEPPVNIDETDPISIGLFPRKLATRCESHFKRAEFRGAAVAPVGMIKQALWKIAGKC
ncbi:unnamed protein product [Prunus armeniaca]|uniref:BHLH domain-containing protein n=1 Tax=Prunus armeniaca TaxID=36596 RepID=A0A6J5WF76_PRUAR|nr:unnamed protein product [Prunus armeniaca]